MGLISNLRGNIKYRIRIFHDNYHIKTVTVKAKGQRFVTVIVENPLIGLKEKLAFMVPHDIKPFVFQGKFLEFNYDIRDATPLSELTDLFPDFIHNLNEDIKTLLPETIKTENLTDDFFEEKPTVIDAVVTDITEPKKEEVKTEEGDQEQKPAEPQSELQPEPITTEIIKKEGTVKKAITSAVKVTKDSGTLLKEMIRLHLTDDSKTKDKVKKVMDICARHPTLLYWLPKAMKIDKEIYSLVSAKAIYRTGIMPSYYAAQSGALISEKVLERPKEQPSWITVALVGVIGIVIIALLLIATRKP
jgi:hypothetical protein